MFGDIFVTQESSQLTGMACAFTAACFQGVTPSKNLWPEFEFMHFDLIGKCEGTMSERLRSSPRKRMGFARKSSNLFRVDTFLAVFWKIY